MLWLKRRALTIRGCGVSNRESPGSGWKPYWACKGIGDSSGNIVGAMEKALENPDTWLKEHERKGAEGREERRWRYAGKGVFGGYNEKREPTFADSLGVILFYVLVGMKGFEPSTP